MYSRSFGLLLTLAVICTCFAHYGPPRCRPRWRKLTKCGKQVCFQGSHSRPGIFNSRYGGFLGAVMLVHKSGQIRCGGGAQYNSNFGCHAFHSLTNYPLNVVVTNSANKIKFPISGMNLKPGNPAYWYGLDGRNSRSKKIVLQHSFGTPYYVNKGQQLKVWYGEDLFNKWESDNRGRVCVDVYGYFL